MSHTHVKESFSYWASNPKDTTATDLAPLEKATEDYPYCQLLHFLKATAVANYQPERTAQVVQTSAAYALSRNALRKTIENEFEWSEHLNLRQQDWFKSMPKEHESYHSTTKFGLPDLSKLTFDFDRIAKASIPDTPPIDDKEFRENEIQNELNQFAKAKVHEQKLEDERQDQLDIIDSYIENEAMLGPIRINMNDISEPEDLVKKRGVVVAPPNIVSEGMAKLMLRQGKVERAIEIYEQLILKKPEKKAYFVEKIKELTTE